MYAKSNGTIQFSNFGYVIRPTYNCHFLHLCRLENLLDTLVGKFHMRGRAGDEIVYELYTIAPFDFGERG